MHQLNYMSHLLENSLWKISVFPLDFAKFFLNVQIVKQRMRDKDLAICFPLFSNAGKSSASSEAANTHTYTNTHIKVYVCISACLRVPGVLQICLISKTNLSSELFSPSHCLLMICLYFNISESLQLRWKKTTWEDLKGILSLTSLCEGILSLSLNSSIADSCFWENQGVAPGRQRKGIDGVETSRNVKGKEQRRRFGGLWWRFKQKEISNSSKSLTPCAERPGMHLRIRDCGHAYILLVQNHSVLIHPTRYQPLCIFIFFPLFSFLAVETDINSEDILICCQQTQNSGKSSTSKMWRAWPQNSHNIFQN